MNISQKKYAVARLTDIAKDRANVETKTFNNLNMEHRYLQKVTVADFLEAMPEPMTTDLIDSQLQAKLEDIFDMAQLIENAKTRYNAAMTGYDMSLNLQSNHVSIINPLTCKSVIKFFCNSAVHPRIDAIQRKLNVATDNIMLGNDAQEVQAIIDAF